MDASKRRALARYAILETPADPVFDDLAGLARSVTGADVSGIGFNDGNRIWFKSLLGLDVSECAAEDLPECRGPGALTSAGPFILGDREFSSWAGVPLITGEGYLLGQLFVLGSSAPVLSAQQQDSLTALARQVLADLELRRTLLFYHAVVDGVGHVVFQLDEARRLVSVTPKWSALTRFGVVRSVGRPMIEFVHEADRGRVEGQLALLEASSDAITFECRLQRLVGGDVPVEVIARPMIDEVGVRHGLVGVIADVTERRAREVEVQHAQKLEALGRLSAGLAHEMNTPIQFVGDNTRFLSEACEALSRLIGTYRAVQRESSAADLPQACRSCQDALERAEREADLEFLTDEVPAAIEQSLDGLERVRTLVKAMRTFSHPGEAKQSPADLNEALSSAVAVARSQVEHVADLQCEFGELPPVMCSIGDLNQVFLNLLINAADAIAGSGRRGTLTINTSVDGDHAVVAFSDTGTGIPEDIRLRIFEPFFTTKEVGCGTGQGLAMARSVVHDKHRGRIMVTSTVGKGSTFAVWLPLAGRSARSGTRAEPQV